jgi:hypothetical protein
MRSAGEVCPSVFGTSTVAGHVHPREPWPPTRTSRIKTGNAPSPGPEYDRDKFVIDHRS